MFNPYIDDYLQMRELTEQVASTQSHMERALRDKVAALNDLENAKLQIKRYDQEVSLVSIFLSKCMCQLTNKDLARYKRDLRDSGFCVQDSYFKPGTPSFLEINHIYITGLLLF